ncbi:MAG: nucleotidyltransferase domain-containing protein [Pseudomonadota bacterium]|jgi:predicted nucleotidyltransferase
MARAFHDILPSSARVYLFGSRIDPTKRGGDIDLLVHIPGVAVDHALRIEEKLLARLWDEIGDQKIDVVVTPELGDRASPFVQLVALDAIPLWP